ncbi:hypothetical protein [Caulobacter sp. 17J65-9]|uniref:hypothetical protein n=1 Tax=Caulobacter sp. 17J65-9 TaxID=2709382 RepID=UPI0013C81625|nr:hypothetical protein [Caulobacter sp. 17J65-9]NEX92393.1 hypothetical protein [Caulobacter sp. 17J65-9]
MSRATYTTTPLRAVLGLLVGAAAAGALWCPLALPVTSSVIWRTPDVWTFVRLAAQGWVSVTPIYLAGLFALGAPGWAVMHNSGLRRPTDAMSLGAGLNLAPIALLLALFLAAPPHHAPVALFALTGAAALAGAVVGWVIWRVAYRRVALT